MVYQKSRKKSLAKIQGVSEIDHHGLSLIFLNKWQLAFETKIWLWVNLSFYDANIILHKRIKFAESMSIEILASKL